jgi:hypothetical protein
MIMIKMPTLPNGSLDYCCCDDPLVARDFDRSASAGGGGSGGGVGAQRRRAAKEEGEFGLRQRGFCYPTFTSQFSVVAKKRRRCRCCYICRRRRALSSVDRRRCRRAASALAKEKGEMGSAPKGSLRPDLTFTSGFSVVAQKWRRCQCCWRQTGQNRIRWTAAEGLRCPPWSRSCQPGHWAPSAVWTN